MLASEQVHEKGQLQQGEEEEGEEGEDITARAWRRDVAMMHGGLDGERLALLERKWRLITAREGFLLERKRVRTEGVERRVEREERSQQRRKEAEFHARECLVRSEERRRVRTLERGEREREREHEKDLLLHQANRLHSTHPVSIGPPMPPPPPPPTHPMMMHHPPMYHHGEKRPQLPGQRWSRLA